MTPAVATIAPFEVAAAVEKAWEEFLLADRRTASAHPNYVYASAWRSCERRMVYEATVPDQQQPFNADTLARFRRGNDRERDIVADLSRIGRNATPEFKVVGQQDAFKLKDRRGRQVISGKVDGFLEIDRQRAPFEVKSWSPFIVDRIESFDDLFDNVWTRSGGYQLLSYLFGHEMPVGFMVLDRAGIPKALPVVLDSHLDRMEEFLAKSERVVDHAIAGSLPDYIQDTAECRRCPFYGAVCNPPLSAKDVQVLTDPEFEATLEHWHFLRDAGREYNALDDRIKKQLRGVENAIAGPFSIIGKWGKSTRTELPPELKKQYTVTDPKGRFSLEITRLSSEVPREQAQGPS